MAAKTSVRIDAQLVDEATETLRARSRTAALHTALKEIVELHRFKKLMKKNGGKLKFAKYRVP